MPGPRRILCDDRLALGLVCALSLATGLALASAGRFPGVDLPQHALTLRRLLDGPSVYFAPRWSTPYSLFFLLCAPLAVLFDPARAVWIATSWLVALLPLSSALLAKAFGRSPWLGLFALLAAFSSPVAWGFSSLVLGASLLALSAAAALTYTRCPSRWRACTLCALLVLGYFAHSVTWSLSLALCALIVVAYARAQRLRRLLPVLLASALTFPLFAAWSERPRPWAERALHTHFHTPEPTLAQRLELLPCDAAALGREAALEAPWLLLAACFVLALLVNLHAHYRQYARARRLHLARPERRSGLRGLRWLRRLLPAFVFSACLLAYLSVPLWVDGVFLVYPRFLLIAALLAPLALGARSHALRCIALTALVPGVWLVSAAQREIQFNAERTACFDQLLAAARPNEALLELPAYVTAPGYVLPIDLHLAAELSARRGGQVGFEFADLGGTLVAYRAHVDRLIAPPNLLWQAKRYDHAQQGGEFSAWLTFGSPRGLGRVLANFAGDKYRVTRCGAYALVVDASVAAGSQPHSVFLPHSTGHGADGCHMGLHGPASLDLQRLFKQPGSEL